MVVTKPEFDKAMKEINEFAVAVNKRLDELEAVKPAPATKTATKAK